MTAEENRQYYIQIPNQNGDAQTIFITADILPEQVLPLLQKKPLNTDKLENTDLSIACKRLLENLSCDQNSTINFTSSFNPQIHQQSSYLDSNSLISIINSSVASSSVGEGSSSTLQVASALSTINNSDLLRSDPSPLSTSSVTLGGGNNNSTENILIDNNNNTLVATNHNISSSSSSSLNLANNIIATTTIDSGNQIHHQIQSNSSAAHHQHRQHSALLIPISLTGPSSNHNQLHNNIAAPQFNHQVLVASTMSTAPQSSSSTALSGVVNSNHSTSLAKLISEPLLHSHAHNPPSSITVVSYPSQHHSGGSSSSPLSSSNYHHQPPPTKKPHNTTTSQSNIASSGDGASHQFMISGSNIDEFGKRKEQRLLKNREAARECRRKKKEYVKCLEKRVSQLEEQNKVLVDEINRMKQMYPPPNVVSASAAAATLPATASNGGSLTNPSTTAIMVTSPSDTASLFRSSGGA